MFRLSGYRPATEQWHHGVSHVAIEEVSDAVPTPRIVAGRDHAGIRRRRRSVSPGPGSGVHLEPIYPVTEQEWARNTLLPKFTEETGVRVQFTTENEGPYVDRLLAETKAGKVTIDVTGTLHGIFPVFIASNAIADMTAVQQRLDARRDRTFFPDLLRFRRWRASRR